MADTFTTNLNLTKPEPGAAEDTWGISLNADLDALDAIFSTSGTQINLHPNQVNFADNKKAIFGTGNDLQIYHDSTVGHSIITDVGTGNLLIRGTNLNLQDASGFNYLVCEDTGNGGVVKLRHNDVNKLATTSTGIDVTGVITTDGMTTSADIRFGDEDKALFGASNDLKIYHSANNQSYIHEVGSGDLNILATNLKLQDSGGSTKVLVNSTGIDVTGTVTSDGLILNTNTSLYNTDATLSNYASNNGVYLNGHIGGWLRINADRTGNQRWDLFGNNGGGFIRGLTQNKNRIDIANNGDISFYEDTGTSQALFWDASAERLGIGTTSPSTTLEVNAPADNGIKISSTTPYLFFNDTDTAHGYDGSISQSGTTLFVGGATPAQGIVFRNKASFGESARISTAGNFGIGTNSPNKALTVAQAQTSGAAVEVLRLTGSGSYSSSGSIGAGAALSFGQYHDTYPSWNLAQIDGVRDGSSWGGALVFKTNDNTAQTNSTERMRLDSSGRLGIGTTSAGTLHGAAYGTTRLHVDGGTDRGQIILEGNVVSSFVMSHNNATANSRVFTTQVLNGLMKFKSLNDNGTSKADILSMTSSGSVGIGTTSPAHKLTVAGGNFVLDNAYGVFFGDANTGMSGRGSADSQSHVAWRTNGSERARIDASGNLLVGKTSNSFSTAGFTVTPSGTIQPVVNGGAAANFNRLSSDGDIVDFRKDGSVVGSIRSFGGDLIIQTGITGLRFQDGADAIHPVIANGSVSDNATDLGLSNARFKDLYLSGTANVNALDIKSGSSTHGTITTSSSSLTLNARNTGILLFQSGGNEKARIDASGNLLVGTTSTVVGSASSGKGFRVDGANGIVQAAASGVVSAIFNRTSSDGDIVSFRKNGTSVGSIGTEGGRLIVGSDDTYLFFDSGSTPSIRPHDGSAATSGVVDIGESGSRFKNLFLDGYFKSGSNVYIGKGSSISGSYGADDIVLDSEAANSKIIFRNLGGSESARIDGSGNLLVGTTTSTLHNQSSVEGVSIQDNNIQIASGLNGTGVALYANRCAFDGEVIRLSKSGTKVGSINVTSSATTYNTSSDARLKDVTGEAKGLEIINKLNPVAYNWKVDNKSDEGLIAQEVEEIVPNSVSKGDDGYYQMDYSKLVTPLIKAVQEQQEQIESLKSEIANLKGE